MSLGPHRGKCMYCGHDHDTDVFGPKWSPPAVSHLSAIALAKLASSLLQNVKADAREAVVSDLCGLLSVDEMDTLRVLAGLPK